MLSSSADVKSSAPNVGGVDEGFAAPRGRAVAPGWFALVVATAAAAVFGPHRAVPLVAQSPEQPPEQVGYWNVRDSTYLTAFLTLPDNPGPHPGLVLLSIAGTDPLVSELAQRGYAVLVPGRRGFVAVEPLLRATYADLAGDAEAALDYLGSRADVDGSAIGLIGQADDAPAAMLAAAGIPEDVPLVLLAPPGFPGRERFRLEQQGLARVERYTSAEREALDRLVSQIADAVLTETYGYVRESALRSVLARSSVRLPYNAAFPVGDQQVHFFASPLWGSRMSFEPEAVLARLHSPVLLLIGAEDPDLPMDDYLTAVRQGLSEADHDDVTVCRIPGRTRHQMSDTAVSVIAGWLGGRVASGEGVPAASDDTFASACLADDEESPDPAAAEESPDPADGHGETT